VTVANGLDAKAVEEQIEEIEQINEEMNDFTILKGIEVDILEDGSLDLPDTVLKKLDICVCSLHYKLDLSREKQTRRVLKAMENPCFNIWAHPTSREIHKRDPVDIDMEKVMKEAADRGIFMEINSSPRRLDLNDVHCKNAKEAGIQIAISTDSHAADSLKQLKYGVNQARRGWLEAEDVINTRSANEVIKMMSR
jgi:DNA polymerase (family 10)